jgi:hypothetical protein
MERNMGIKWLGLLFFSLGILGLMVGCGSVLQEQKKESESVATTSTAAPAITRADRPNARYYDFEDVKIPNELTLNTSKSRVFQTPAIAAGVLVFDGYVESNSLVTFFKESMAKDNWQFKAMFKLPPKTHLLFEKKNKRSLINIEDGWTSTRVDVWVMPTQDGQ